MSHSFFHGGPRRYLAGLLILALYGCGDSAVRALAGTYVTTYDESGADNIHSRTALTLRPDYHWTSASELVINGRDGVAGARIRDGIAPPSHTDSGTFALQGVILAVRSEREGVSHYTVSGDTLWTHNAAMAALGTAVTGVKVTGASEGFMVRQR